MNCPVCRSHEQSEIHLHSGSFNEDLVECSSCGSRWAIQHAAISVVEDRHENSFLEMVSECVEGYDYGILHA